MGRRSESLAIVNGKEVDVASISELAELTYDHVIRTTLSGRIIFWSRNAEKRYGWTPEEAQGQNVHELLKTEFPQPPEDIQWAVLRNGQWEGELLHTARSGARVVVASRWHLERNHKGEPTAILRVSRDITEHRRTQAAALGENPERLHLALLASHVGVWDWDLAANWVYYAAEWKQLLGYSEDEVSGGYQEWAERLHPADRDAVEASLRTYLADPQGEFEAEYRLRRKDGSYVWVLTRATVVRDARGKPARMVGTDLDITARKQAEARLRRVVESNMIAIAYWKRDGSITDANDAYLELTGYTREQLRAGQLNWRIITPPEYLGLTERALQELEQRAVSTPIEKEYVRPDGTRVPILVGHAWLEADEGIAYVLDLTERRRAEEELRIRQATIQQLSTPVLRLEPGLLVAPLIGAIDTDRIKQLSDQLLKRVRAERARAVVLDITGVPTLDSAVAAALVHAVDAARLLGAQVIVTGISREITHTLVDEGIDWTHLNTAGDLQSGFEQARASLSRGTARI